MDTIEIALGGRNFHAGRLTAEEDRRVAEIVRAMQLLEDLRAAIVRKKEVTAELAVMGFDLAVMGFDPEEAGRKELARKSRALHQPATSGGPGNRKDNRLGFGRK